MAPQPPRVDRAVVAAAGRAAIRGCAGRMMLVRRCQMVPVECVVRGYLSGSGWKEYQAAGVGVRRRASPPGSGRPTGCPRRSSRRPPRRPSGTHDEAMTFDAVVAAIGR